jgi:hypothetical protein
MIFGFFIGMLAAILGVGGGVLMVPMLNLLIGLDIHKAIGTSLFVMVFLSTTAAISYFRKKLVLWKLALIFLIGNVIGAYLGANASNLLPPHYLKIAFALVLLYVSYRMLRGSKSAKANKEYKIVSSLNVKRFPLIIGLGIVSGFLSGLLGIGGGIINVPILKMLLSIPMHSSVATSSFMISITSFVASSSHFLMNNVEQFIGILLAPTTILGSYTGAKVAVKLRSIILSRLFAIVLIIVAMRMVISL